MAKQKKSERTDCLLIHVPHLAMHNGPKSIFFANVIAVGVFSLSNELKKAGFNPEIINLGVEKALNRFFDVAQYIKNNHIKIVGFSVHWHYQIYDSLLVAEHIKKVNPDVFIFFGGITSSAFADDILKEHPQVDAIIKGEGEKPIVELVSKIKLRDHNFTDIPNLYWKDTNHKIHRNKKIWFANEEELNSYNFDGLEFLKNCDKYLHFPIRYENNYFDTDFKKTYPYKCVVACLGRGCPGNCTWCGGGFNAIKCITGRNKITLRNPEVVARELLSLKKKYDDLLLYICYDPFPKKQDYLVKLFNILGQNMPKQIQIDFECFSLPTKEFIDAFSDNLDPRSRIIISPEFGDEGMRKKHKAFYFSNTELMECIDYMMDKKVALQLYFTEIPYETQESKIATIQLAKGAKIKTQEIIPLTITHQKIVDVEPYSPWAINPEKYGMPNPPDLQYYINNSKGLRDFI